MRRRVIQALVDMGAWYVGVAAAMLIRADFDATAVAWQQFLWVATAGALLQLGFGTAAGLYRGRYLYGAFEEVLAVVASVTGTTLVLTGLAFLTRSIPLSRPVAAGACAGIVMLGVRYGVRAYHDFRHRPGDAAAKVILFGAGEAGHTLLRSMQRDPTSPYRVVALLDDDPAKRNLRLMGVPVLGGRERIGAVAAQTGAEVLVVGIANIDASDLRPLNAAAIAAGLSVKVVPSVARLVGGGVDVFSLRDIDESDLLGRKAVHTDMSRVAELVHGRRILITGAGGSIGSELARQIAQFEPASLSLLDRDENGLHATSLDIWGRALLDDDATILGSIRDPEWTLKVFRRVRPEVVFHAAALKHLPLLEHYPTEAVKTNVFGTLNVLQAARDVGVFIFVNISTDKAADPVSVLGYSKRITERLTAAAGYESSGIFVSVRFGNVLASHGSVLHSFAAQINAGGPVTVTHRDITRFFMTIPEAVQLVLQAAAIGDDGQVLVLDMGEPVRIADVAQQLIEHSGRPIRIVYTGLRPGEKLNEDLIGAGETDYRPRHPLVSQIVVPPLWPSMLARLDDREEADEVRAELREVALAAVPPTGSDRPPRLRWFGTVQRPSPPPDEE